MLRRAVASGVVLGVVAGALTAGCSVLGGDEWVPLDEALATRQEVRDRTQELAAIIADQGLVPFGADGFWTGCTDDSYAYQYTGSARLDADGSSATMVSQVVDALVAQAGLDTDGPGAYNNPEVARGTLGDVDVRVRGYAEGPEFMLEVFGPCMPIAPEDRDDLDQGDRGGQDLDIGGPHHIEPDSDTW